MELNTHFSLFTLVGLQKTSITHGHQTHNRMQEKLVKNIDSKEI
jgi:hypothetical protein